MQNNEPPFSININNGEPGAASSDNHSIVVWMHQMERMYPEQYHKLVLLLKISRYIALKSNIPWKLTSWIRISRTHQGESVDIAPSLPDSDYAHNKGSDPILTRRSNLRAFLIKLAPSINEIIDSYSSEFRCEIFIETHHLHVMLKPRGAALKNDLVKLAIFAVPVYPDSEKRNNLPKGTKLNPQSILCGKPDYYIKEYFYPVCYKEQP